MCLPSSTTNYLGELYVSRLRLTFPPRIHLKTRAIIGRSTPPPLVDPRVLGLPHRVRAHFARFSNVRSEQPRGTSHPSACAQHIVHSYSRRDATPRAVADVLSMATPPTDGSKADGQQAMHLSQEIIGGVFSRAQWNSAGGDGRQLERSLRQGAFTRIRQGWFALPDASSRAIHAVKLASRLTCVDALKLHGAWDTKPPEVHLRVSKGQPAQTASASTLSRDSLRSGVVWHRALSETRLSKTCVDGIELALDCAFRCLPEEELVMVTDSLLNRGIINEVSYEQLKRRSPARVQERLAAVDGRSMSGTESKVRLWLLRHGHRVLPQFEFQRDKFADLLVDGWLVIECDSRAHHTSLRNYLEDRARDLILQAMGFVVVRLTYEQVILNWAATEAKLRRILARGGQSAQPLRR